MNKIAVALCEEDDVYRNRFVTYLMEHKAKEIMVYAFSEQESFLEEYRKTDFDVVLLGSGFLQMRDSLQGKEQKTLVLSETMPAEVAELDRYQGKNESAIRTIFRYQAMEAMLHEIYVMSDADRADYPLPGGAAVGKEVIGVYSPCRHEMQLPFSLVLAHLLSEKRKVLYLNLMAHSGFLQMFHLSGVYDMGDMLVKLRNHRLLPEVYRRCVYEMERIFVIPPFPNPENLHEFARKDFCMMLQFLKEQTELEVILIDFGEGLESFSTMLEECTSIYCPCRAGYLYECQKESFLQYLEGKSDAKLANRLHFIELPYLAKGIRGGGDVLRQLIYSEFGDYVRACFAGQV